MEEYKKCIIMLIAAFSGLFLGGCESPQSRSADGENKIDAPVQLDKTVGKVAEFSSMAIIPVKGIGIVVGLPGTGSSECPPDVRSYLNHYILSRLGSARYRVLI